MRQLIHGRAIDDWQTAYPLLKKMMSTNEVLWFNPQYTSFSNAETELPFSKQDVYEAEERLKRFAPYIATVFPETKDSKGNIESPLIEINNMQKELMTMFRQPLPGKMFLKCDNQLPIAGSIKARGGIYEVLKYAEELALHHGLMPLKDDYSIFVSDQFRAFFSQYSITVGSTGNLGLSIGIMSAKLGFRVNVHMSADAKQWKKDLLRKNGVNVIEHTSDYSYAVEMGRKEAAKDPNNYFIDDENSENLFMGYAVAALRLQKQLKENNILVDENHPLLIYLPCGVGGAPGGIAFGLKLLFGDAVHCFFAEPTHSPCMLLGMMTGLHDQVSVQDFGIDNQTEADGLAVGRPSRFVGKIMERLVSGIYTIKDEHLFKLLTLMMDTEGIALEPSALAGVYGPIQMVREGTTYFANNGLTDKIQNAIHICWATGGSLVPREEMNKYYEKGVHYIKKRGR